MTITKFKVVVSGLCVPLWLVKNTCSIFWTNQIKKIKNRWPQSSFECFHALFNLLVVKLSSHQLIMIFLFALGSNLLITLALWLYESEIKSPWWYGKIIKEVLEQVTFDNLPFAQLELKWLPSFCQGWVEHLSIFQCTLKEFIDKLRKFKHLQ